jgi:hypothetical protein
LVITLIIVGGVLVLGGGACVVLGGLVWLGANAEPEDPAALPASPPTAKTGQSPSTPPPVPEPPPTAASEDGEEGDPSSDPTGVANAPVAPTAGKPSAGGTKYFCNATGWVRVCGFANVCSNQMVSGIGSGSDRFMASTMAKNACEGMARAKGGSTVCTVACSAR